MKRSDPIRFWSVSGAQPTWTCRVLPAGSVAQTLTRRMKPGAADAREDEILKKKNLYQIYQHTFNPVSLFFISYVRMKKCHLVVLSPSDDAYYYWLIVIGLAVFYNWTLLVVRWEIINFVFYTSKTNIKSVFIIPGMQMCPRLRTF